MDAFSYLSVLLSIIIGLAITQILQGYRGLLLSRSRVTLYGPTLILSGLMLAFATQSWWASFGLADRQGWNFGDFAMVLLQTIILYMMAAVVLPDTPPGEPIDLRAHYYRERVPYFSLSLAMLVVSVGKEWILDGRLPHPANLAFHGIFAVASLVGLLVGRPRVHLLLVPTTALVAAVYIALLFSRLAP